MIRSIIAVFAVGAGLGALCTTGGCSQTGVGDPCTPDKEYLTDFPGFSVNEVVTETHSFQCQTRLCLVNHFQGRVTCPYGQSKEGNAPEGASQGCYLPGSRPVDKDREAAKVVGPIDPDTQEHNPEIKAQCRARTANTAVYCSCRCANIDGKTDDGANYCTCPENFECKQLVTSIGSGDTGLTGAYCIKKDTAYSDGQCNAVCDATKKKGDSSECGKPENTGI